MAGPTAKIVDIDTSALGNASAVALKLTVAVVHDGATYYRTITYRLPDEMGYTTNHPPSAEAVKADVAAVAQAVSRLKELAASLAILKDADLVAADVAPVKV